MLTWGSSELIIPQTSRSIVSLNPIKPVVESVTISPTLRCNLSAIMEPKTISSSFFNQDPSEILSLNLKTALSFLLSTPTKIAFRENSLSSLSL